MGLGQHCTQAALNYDFMLAVVALLPSNDFDRQICLIDRYFNTTRGTAMKFASEELHANPMITIDAVRSRCIAFNHRFRNMDVR